MCNVPPVSRALFAEANHRWPRRSQAGDGTCPSRDHHAANPNSDHEPDWRLHSYSCAVDLTHDPAHGVDAHGVIAETLRIRCQRGIERRVKYLIRHNFQHGYDEIAEPSNGWTWRYAHQNQHASHLHISLVHSLGVLNDTSPWFSTVGSADPAQPPPHPKELAEVLTPPIIDPTRPAGTNGRIPYFQLDTSAKNILAFNGARLESDRTFGPYLRIRQANIPKIVNGRVVLNPTTRKPISGGAIPNELTGMFARTVDDHGRKLAKPVLVVTAADGGTFAYGIG